MRSKKFVLGIFVAAIMLAMIPLTASQVTVAQITDPAVFSDDVKENMILIYQITEFEAVGTSGNVSLGYDPSLIFRGYNLSTSQLGVGKFIYVKVDSRDDNWDVQEPLIYERWWAGAQSWSPNMNVTISDVAGPPSFYQRKPEGTTMANELGQVLVRPCVLPIQQKLIYPPTLDFSTLLPNTVDYSNYLVDTWGPYDDNGTGYIGDWYYEDATNNMVLNYTYDVNSTYYMFTDDWFIYYGGGPEPHVAFNKIPATFTVEGEKVLAHWNHSWYGPLSESGNPDQTLFGYHYRYYSGAWDGGIWPMPAFMHVTTDIATGIAESVEFDFTDDGAFKNEDIYGTEGHPLASQLSKLKYELYSISYGAAPGFEITFVFIGISVAALAVYFTRRRK